MQIVASYFEPERAALAADALRRAGIPFEQRPMQDETSEGIEIAVPEDQLDRAAEIVEKLEDLLLAAQESKPVECPECGSRNLSWRKESGFFGDYVYGQCDDCHHEFLHHGR